MYEVAPVEPLHDIKGHIHNLIEELQKRVVGIVLSEVKKVIDTALSKETLRCSDYRKTIILIYKALLETSSYHKLTKPFQTAVEVT